MSENVNDLQDNEHFKDRQCFIIENTLPFILFDIFGKAHALIYSFKVQKCVNKAHFHRIPTYEYMLKKTYIIRMITDVIRTGYCFTT